MRIIDADELKKNLETEHCDCEMMAMIDNMPTVDETANWIICCDGYYPFCSVCGEEPPGREMSRYCPNCGRRMVTPERRKA
jgi:hypothetical protein